MPNSLLPPAAPSATPIRTRRRSRLRLPGRGGLGRCGVCRGQLADADVFSYHGYDLFDPESYRRVGQWAVRGRAAPLPIWNTETGATSRTFYRRLPERFSDPYTNWLRPTAYDLAAEQSTSCSSSPWPAATGVFPLLVRLGKDLLAHRRDDRFRVRRVAASDGRELRRGRRFTRRHRGEGLIELPGPALACLLRDDRRMIAVLWHQGGRRPRRLLGPIGPLETRRARMWANPVPLTRSAAGFEVSLTGRPLYLIAPVADAKPLTDALGQATMVK